MIFPTRIFNKNLFHGAILVLGLLYGVNAHAGYIQETVKPGSNPITADIRRLVSADGRYVVYGATQIYIRDTVLDSTEIVSLSSLGVQGNATSAEPSVSDDGRYVSFESDATNLVDNDTNGVTDAFVYDRNLDTIERVNVSSLGVEANNLVHDVEISANGRFVTFLSSATNLIDGEVSNGHQHVYLYDRDANTMEKISVDSLGNEADSDSINLSISEDGRYVAFDSYATNLVPGFSGLGVYVKDVNTGAIEIVSITDEGLAGNSSSFDPHISSDGRFVSFESLATNFATGDTNGSVDVFIYDRTEDTIEIAGISSDEVIGDSGSFDGSISTDGRYVVFWSTSTNLVSNDTNGVNDIFLRDRLTGETKLIGVNTRYSIISSDGTYAVFHVIGTGLVLYSINNLPIDITLSDSSINENEDAVTIVAHITSTDPDSEDILTYSLACAVPGVDDGAFSIEDDILYSNQSFDYDTDSLYSICIRADDNNGGTYDENFSITILESSNSSSSRSNRESKIVKPDIVVDPFKMDCQDFFTRMQWGSRGGGVSRLQTVLNRLNFNVGAVDGIFGPKTYMGVKGFQSANALFSDGIVGPLTRGILNLYCEQ